MSDEIRGRLSAALGDEYEIEGPLGEGGMALVYLARDVKHDRQVAIKVLKPDLAASLGAERFLREIQITAKLQHPHILPLYDSGEADDLLYYVMPFVEGESLADMIEREKQLSIDEAIRITKEVAGALGHAHAYGLVHRDIKPDNIMMSGGHAIVADFGISKAVSDAGGTGVTSTGTSIGTPAYMSPEQAAGDPNVDGRTDIYALGCMLYEMLVGQPPFTGPNAQAIIARHTMDQVPPPSIMRQTIMPELEDVIFCAMAKTPADRFRTAQEMMDTLSAIEAGGSPKMRTTRATTRISVAVPQPAWKRAIVPVSAVVAVAAVAALGWQLFLGRSGGAPVAVGEFDPRRVAVLYFEDLSPAGDWRDVADGITEGLIARLATVQALDVVSRNGVAPYRDPAIPRDSVARALEAGSVVAGSVEPVGNDIRVTARLFDETGTDVGTRATFQLPAENVLAAQDSVAEAVSNFLRERLGEEVRTRELRSTSASGAAWRLVQRAERLRKEAEELVGEREFEAAAGALTRADSLLALAEESDPQWVEPRLSRGWIAYQRAIQLEEGRAGVPWLESAVEYADQAMQQVPNYPRALELRGTARYRLWELQATPDPDSLSRVLQGARDDLLDAVEADRSLARAYITLSYLYYALEDVPQALMAAQSGYEADAYLENANDLVERQFWASLDLEIFDRARYWCAQGAERFSDDWRFYNCQLWLMATPAANADVDRAWELKTELNETIDHPYINTQTDYLVGGVLARAGLVDSARSVFLRTRDKVSGEFDPELELLSLEAYLRTLTDEPEDLDEAIDLLKRVAAANPNHDWEESAGTWWWREIRSHPRFGELTGRR